MPVKNPHNIFVISGPSGAGEDSVINGLRKKMKFNRVITTVTRAKRAGEANKRPYYFISVPAFKKLIETDAFVEWAIVYGDYRGCTKAEIERLLKLKAPILWKADWQGVKTIKKQFPGTVAVFVTPTSYHVLEDRLIKRGVDSIETIKKRAAETKDWLKQKKVYDHVVYNKEGKLTETIEKVYAILQAEFAEPAKMAKSPKRG